MLKPMSASFLFAALWLAVPSIIRADEPKPLATAKHPTGLIVEVLSATADDTVDKVKVVWRYRNPTKKGIRLVEPKSPFAVAGPPPHKAFFDEIHYSSGKLSKMESYRHGVVRTVDGKYYDATDIRRLGILVPVGGSYEVFARFSKPVVKTDTIHLQLPEVSTFENLPLGKSKGKAGR
jgi:hypothetical protein